MKDECEWVNSFFNKVVKGWMIGDLNRLTGIRPIPFSDGNCNFPIALYLFSCIEFLGYLTESDYDLVKSGPSGYSSRRVISYIQNFFPNEAVLAIEPFENLIVSVFRNGLSHEYFAKSAGITRENKNLIYKDELGTLILDADRFAYYFSLSCDNLSNKINSDTELVNRIFTRYRDNYDKNVSFGNKEIKIVTTTTSSANATLPRESYTTTQPIDFTIKFNNKN